MTLSKIFNEIESHDFAARLNLALNYKDFFYLANEETSVKSLEKDLNDPECLKKTIIRIYQLVEEPVDFRYENPYDTAITVYTWVIFSVNPYLGRVVAEYASRTRNGWWAKAYAYYVLQETWHYSEAGAFEFEAVPTTASDKVKSGDASVQINMLGLELFNARIYIVSEEEKQRLSWLPTEEKMKIDEFKIPANVEYGRIIKSKYKMLPLAKD